MGKGEKVVIDTNVFVSAFGWGGTPLKVMGFLENGEIVNCISEEILAELCSALSYQKLDFPVKLQADILEFVLAYSEIHEPKKHVVIASDPKDNKFIDCALKARAKFLITGDKGLLSIRQFQHVGIITPEDFISMRG